MDNWENLLAKAWEKGNEKTENSIIISNVANASNVTDFPKQPLDPRPDLSQDSLLWQQLLAAAQDIDYRLFGALLCMRRAGTKLARNPSGSLRLVPHIDPTGANGWTSQAEYDREKGEMLDPVRDMLVELLGKMAA